MSKLPGNWTDTTIGDVTVTKVKQHKPLPNEHFNYIDISSIDRGTKKILNPQKISGESAPSRARQIVASGDVLVSMTRPNLNAVAMVPDQLDGQIASTGFDVLRPIEFDSRWLYYLVRTDSFVTTMSNLVQGALYPAVRPKDIRGYTFPFAPHPEQKRIADKLDSLLARVDSCQSHLERVPGILKHFRQSVLAAATSGRLTDEWREKHSLGAELDAKDEVARLINTRKANTLPGKKIKESALPDMTYWDKEIPKSWSVESVLSFAECLDYMRIPVKREKRKNVKGLYPYYGANGQVDLVDEFIFDDELVLVTEDETFYGREKPIAYRVSGKCWVNNHAHVLRAADEISSDYLCYCLMYYNVLPWLTGTTGRAKLTQGVLNALPIAIPPKKEMTEIVRRVERLFAFADRLEARWRAGQDLVEQLTPSLLAKAFRGELVEQDAEDESAAVLLERIKAERSVLKKLQNGIS